MSAQETGPRTHAGDRRELLAERRLEALLDETNLIRSDVRVRLQSLPCGDLTRWNYLGPHQSALSMA